MDIRVDNLSPEENKNSLGRAILPGYMLSSTSPLNVEDDIPHIKHPENAPTLRDVINALYQKSKTSTDGLELVIAIHGVGGESWYNSLYSYINKDSSIKENSSIFIGYRWPAERLSRRVLQDAFQALPILLKTLFNNGLLVSLIGITLLILLHSSAFVSLIIIYIILGLYPVFFIFSLCVLRVSLYFRDSYRATHVAFPELVELIQTLERGLIQQRIDELLPEESLLNRVVIKIPEAKLIDRLDLLRVIQKIREELSRKTNFVIDSEDLKFSYLYRKIRREIPQDIDEPILYQIIQQVGLIVYSETGSAVQYWEKSRIKLSFISHGLGADIVTQVIQSISNDFGSKIAKSPNEVYKREMPSSHLSLIFNLGRLILVAPDIPLLSLISMRLNALRSVLRRFSESYVFSNEGDIVLQIYSTIANYISFPSRTRFQGRRLGNIIINRNHASTKGSIRGQSTYGILNKDELADPKRQVIKYLGLNILGISKSQHLDLENQQDEKYENREFVESIDEDKESLANLCSYFDLTEYKDEAIYNQISNRKAFQILTFDRQKSPLTFFNYIRLFREFLTFSPKRFPQSGRDVHGGYFSGKLSQLLIYRLAFLGFHGFLDSLISTEPERIGIKALLPESLKEELISIQDSKSMVSSSSADKLVAEQEKRKIALRYFSWICEQKQIRAIISPERYQVDILGQDQEDIRDSFLLGSFDLPIPSNIDPRDIAIAFKKTDEKIKESYQVELEPLKGKVTKVDRDKESELFVRVATKAEGSQSTIQSKKPSEQEVKGFFNEFLSNISTEERNQSSEDPSIRELVSEFSQFKEWAQNKISNLEQQKSNVSYTYNIGGDYMPEGINISGNTGDISGIVGRDNSGVAGQNMTGVAGGDISGRVTNTISQLPDSPDPNKPGIKELLAELQAAIEAESELPGDDKAEALEQVQKLAEAGQKPEDNALQKAAKTAMKILKGTVSSLPEAAKLAEACAKLLPLISGLLLLV